MGVLSASERRRAANLRSWEARVRSIGGEVGHGPARLHPRDAHPHGPLRKSLAHLKRGASGDDVTRLRSGHLEALRTRVQHALTLPSREAAPALVATLRVPQERRARREAGENVCV